MKRDDIIRMAREADPFGMVGRLYAMAQLTPETLERFASLVAEAERDACAKLCDEIGSDSWIVYADEASGAKCAAAIRARSAP